MLVTMPDLFRYYFEEQISHMTRDKDKVYCELELPGVEEKDVSVCVKDNMLHVTWTRKNRTFNEQYVLDERVDLDSAEATLKNGVLAVSFKLKTTTKQIEVKIN